MSKLFSKISAFIKQCGRRSLDFFRSLFDSVAILFGGGRKSRGRGRRSQTSAYAAQRSESAVGRTNRTNAYGRTQTTYGISPKLTSKHGFSGFWVNAKKWFKKQHPVVLAGMGVGLAIVIAVPIVLVCTLGKKPEPAVDQKVLEQTYVELEETTAEEIDVPITPETVDPNDVSFDEGQTGELVPYIQERLMELGYLDEDIPTDLYGPNTTNSVEYFQREHGLEMDGHMDGEVFTLLFSDAAQTYLVSEGAKGEDVGALQTRLYELGYIETVTSYYGTDTKAAVQRFQELNGLDVDGNVGESTRELLYSDEVKANYIAYGTKSDAVKKYQNRLKKLGYLTTEVDGTYGKDTVNAVKRFQERNGLIADGYLGPTTKDLLMNSAALSNAIILGMSGQDVTKIQTRLKELKYLSKVTGYFGSDTESAVKAFQKRNKLSQDGKVGKVTMNTLMSSNAKKAASGSSSSGGSSGSSGSSGSGSSSGGSSNPVPAANGANVGSLLSVAQSRLGCRYVKAGKGPNVFDCSGFVYWCLKQIGANQSYLTSGGWAANTKYPKITKLSDVQAGDIICFRGHVGIAMGGGMMIDAGSGAGCVRTTSLSLSYWQRNFKCAFRVL